MIPIYINNRDRLTTTRKMVEYLSQLHGCNITIIDNASTYQPLLDWYATCQVTVVRLNSNCGPYAMWSAIEAQKTSYIVTDSDLDLSHIPLDLLDVLSYGLRIHTSAIKVGLSLELNDLPPHSEKIINWERQFWSTKSHGWWTASIDTTLALYRPEARAGVLGPAFRSDRPYTARHIPWYGVKNSEELYYEEHCDLNFASWVRYTKTNSAPGE